MATLPERAIKSKFDASVTVSWKSCVVCERPFAFKSPRQFCLHLREFHCSKEGGSFVCHYGRNGVCPSLPIDGVSDTDYEAHVSKDHVNAAVAAGKSGIMMASEGRNEMSKCLSTSSPAVVQDQYKWTLYMSQVNLPAVLNDPRLNRRETDFFTKTWGEAFEKTHVDPSTHLPNITRDHFKKYLRKTSSKHRDHMKCISNPVCGVDKLDCAFPVLQSRKLEKYQAQFDAIPKIFLQPNFSLEDKDTFSAVFPWTHTDGSLQLAEHPQLSSKLLQEKLHHYLDVVEVQIAKQISLRSESFFLAMTSQDKLQENMLKTCSAIKLLREKVHRLEEVLVAGPLKLMKLSQSRANLLKLFNKLRLMATVHQTQPTLQLLLATNEFVGALDLIATTQEVLTQELTGLNSFRHLGSQLTEMERLIDKMMQEDFVRHVTTDLNRPLTEGATTVEEDDTEMPGDLNETQEKLVAIVLGMLRQGKMEFINVYRQEACTTVKTVIKQTVIEAVAVMEDDDTNTISLADQMRLLDYEKWMDLLNHVFDNLLIVLKRTKVVCCSMTAMLDLPAPVSDMSHDSVGEDDVGSEEEEDAETGTCRTTNAAQPTQHSYQLSMGGDVDMLMSMEDRMKVYTSVKDLLSYVCDYSHDRCVKLMLARGKEGSLEKLTAGEFVQLSRVIEGFVSDTHALCGHRSTSLRSSLHSQVNKFVNRFHEERKTKLSLILDNERWRQADVPAEFQDLVNHISVTGRLCLPDNKSEIDKKAEYLFVDHQQFAVVGTALLLLKMIVEYCQCVSDIPAGAPDILTRLVEVLKTFNSRTCQLILGAGALQLVGLKTITTKNLALASRCLQLTVHYLPFVQQHFADHMPQKQLNMLNHLDHVLKDYKDHIAELANKFVVIMDSMLDASLSKWEVKAPVPSACFRSLCRQLHKLHEAIVDLLPGPQVLELFTRVHTSFKLRLRSQLIKLGVTNDSGPQHGLVVADVTFYMGNLKSLSGLDSLSDTMDDIWDKS